MFPKPASMYEVLSQRWKCVARSKWSYITSAEATETKRPNFLHKN